MNKHRDFILSPIIGILKEVVAANIGIGDGIETYPLSEYVLQSVFLKMTGFQEQKMKCICWELATVDYEYRYFRFTQQRLGECSNYAEKMSIYKDLIDLIKKYEPGFDVTAELDRNLISAETLSEIKALFVGSNVATWAQNNFHDFLNDNNVIPANQFASNSSLLENNLKPKYELLYKHRNRCAHNTLSYQDNLPTLKTLFISNPKDDNYFVRFTLLILIDKIFIALYEKYNVMVDDN
ncbi:hypothetical protein [Mucilaginibacter sp. L196]|uniref:hypothetical protein n=1 Tax=Mucilaginibacter sp. L196 TaxID=1641870 RepID=UPI00131CC58D|nr:hypothetical protein [Mucilaginibacter sp. L196]